MAGNFFGGGYAGIASYFVTGAGDITSNYNYVYVGVSKDPRIEWIDPSLAVTATAKSVHRWAHFESALAISTPPHQTNGCCPHVQALRLQVQRYRTHL